MEQICCCHREQETIVPDQDSGSDRIQSDPESDSDSINQINDEQDESDSDSTDPINVEQDGDDTDSEGRYGVFTGNGKMLRVNETSVDYKSCVNSFNSGMGTAAAAATEVVAVHKNSFPGVTGRARFQTFRLYSEAVAKKCGGDSNSRYAWYSGTKDEIAVILAHGFTFRNGDEFGRIQLLRFAFDAATGLDVSDDGLRHMLLCRVILGKMELVPSGSEQVVPSSNEFDSGTDHLTNCRKYYVWSPFMNSHILPAYVVSFKGPANVNGYVTTNTNYAAASGAGANARNPGRFTVASLVAALTRFLSPREMKIMIRLLDDYKAKKITGEALKQKAKLVAGDKLISAMNLMSSSSAKGSGVQLVDGSVRDIYIPGLITVLAGLLPAAKAARLTKSLEDFKAKKINRLQLIRSVRLIVGNDNVLVQAISSYRMRKQRQQQKSHV